MSQTITETTTRNNIVAHLDAAGVEHTTAPLTSGGELS